TERTSGRTVGTATTANMSTSADTTASVSWTHAGTLSFTNEYLIVQVGIEITSVGGGTTQDMDFRVGTGCTIVTSDFGTKLTGAVTSADSTSATVTPGGGGSTFPGAVSETLSSADFESGQ